MFETRDKPLGMNSFKTVPEIPTEPVMGLSISGPGCEVSVPRPISTAEQFQFSAVCRVVCLTGIIHRAQQPTIPIHPWTRIPRAGRETMRYVL